MLLGKIINGRYQVLSVLSNGKLTQTYLAQNIRQPGYPLCVVKHLPKATDNDCQLWKTARQTLTREAEALKQLSNHDQIPQLLTFFEKHQALYLVRKYIKGVPLSLKLFSDYCWSESQVVQLLQDVLGILKFVHAHEVVHLDIKPENIIKREQDNRLVLINFGLSKRFSYLTTLKRCINAAFTTDQQNPKNDIYALGLLGIQMLSGQRLTQPTKDTDADEILYSAQVQVSTELVSILVKMVRYNSKNCYWSVAEVLQALQPLVDLYLPTQKLKVTLQSSVTAAPFPQILSSQMNTNFISAVNRSAPLVNSQVNKPSYPTSHDKSLLLIGIIIGISTSMALVLSFLWLLSATPENPKKPVSLLPQNTRTEILQRFLNE